VTIEFPHVSLRLHPKHKAAAPALFNINDIFFEDFGSPVSGHTRRRYNIVNVQKPRISPK